MKIVNLLKPGRFFDIKTYTGLIKLTFFHSILVILLWYYPILMEYEGAQRNWWFFFSILMGTFAASGSIHGFLLIFTKKYHPNVFKKIATKEYLEFTEQTIDCENKTGEPSVANTRPGDQE